MKNMSDKYKCAVCDGIFTKGWTDEEAAAELGQKFPGVSTDNCDLVCDDCYKKMGFGGGAGEMAEA
jgi:hypothetical protein